MTDESAGAAGGEGPDILPEEGTGEGVELTTGEPNTFEPEEDPDAGAGADMAPAADPAADI